WAVLQNRGPFAVGAVLAERVLGLSSLSAQERASTEWIRGVTPQSAGRSDQGRAHVEAALALARDLGNRRLEGGVLNTLGLLHREQGRMDEARAYYDAALPVVREVGDRRVEGIVL